MVFDYDWIRLQQNLQSYNFYNYAEQIVLSSAMEYSPTKRVSSQFHQSSFRNCYSLRLLLILKDDFFSSSFLISSFFSLPLWLSLLGFKNSMIVQDQEPCFQQNAKKVFYQILSDSSSIYCEQQIYALNMLSLFKGLMQWKKLKMQEAIPTIFLSLLLYQKILYSSSVRMKDECYQFLKNQIGKVDIVGFGSYGEVKLARNTQNNEIVAIKMIYNKNAKQEIDVHHKLNHAYIIKLLNYYYQKQKNITYMVLEYASGGSLNEKIKFGYGQLNKQLVKRYFKDICEAVKYLHQNNYMHRDIKPQNILITKDNHAKLCDFGFASILQYRSTLCGTFQYMAPEMIQKKPYDYKIDVWGLGILLFELIQGYAPFRGQTGEQVISQMKKPLIFSSRFDPVQIDLIKKILRVNAQNRLEISKILDHPYFKQSPQEQIPQLQQPNKDLKSLKQQFKNVKETKFQAAVDNKKKQGERKFDFLQRKGEKRDQKKIQKVEENVDKRQFPKETIKEQIKKQENKKEEIKKQFKPYIPPSLNNQRSAIKSPLMKPMPQTGFIPLTSPPTGFQQNPHYQFNNSMQIPPSHNQNNQINSPNYQYSSQNASMTTAPIKYFPATNPTILPQPVNYTQPNFHKAVGPTYLMEQRSPNNQAFSNPLQTQTSAPSFLWKKN